MIRLAPRIEAKVKLLKERLRSFMIFEGSGRVVLSMRACGEASPGCLPQSLEAVCRCGRPNRPFEFQSPPGADPQMWVGERVEKLFADPRFMMPGATLQSGP